MKKQIEITLVGSLLLVSLFAYFAKIDWQEKNEVLQAKLQVKQGTIIQLKDELARNKANLRIQEEKIVELESQPK